jgi:carbohydrate-binding DOMON domain-containing protein
MEFDLLMEMIKSSLSPNMIMNRNKYNPNIITNTNTNTNTMTNTNTNTSTITNTNSNTDNINNNDIELPHHQISRGVQSAHRIGGIQQSQES